MIATSIIYNWIQRIIQPLQRQDHGTKDSSRLSAEPVERDEALKRARVIFPDHLSVPYVHSLFRATNPPQVRVIWLCLLH